MLIVDKRKVSLKMANQELYNKLKAVTDKYIGILHQLKGYHIDSLFGFKAYLKEIQALQVQSSRQLNTSINTLDKRGIVYAQGDPTDPSALVTHECTQGELKGRLKKGGLNENMVGQFCLVMAYEYWEKVRGSIADILKKKRNDIKSDIFGDMRYIRHDIVHNIGIATKENSAKAFLLKWFKNGDPIIINDPQLDIVIGHIFDYLNQLVRDNTGLTPYPENSLSLTGKAKQMRQIKG